MKSPISLSELLYYIKCDRASFLKFIRENKLGHLIDDERISKQNMHELLAFYTDRFGLHNKKWEIPAWLSSNTDKWAQTLVEMYGEDVSFPASLPPSQGKQLRDLILRFEPENVVEVGCFIGVSSIWIGSALKALGKGHLYSIDLFQDKYPAFPFHWGYLENSLGYANAKKYAAELDDYITFVRMKSGDYGKRLSQFSNNKIDFLFLDGDHTVGGCVDDFISYYPYVKEGGTILLHDIYPEHCGWNGPRYLLNNVCTDRNLFHVSEIQTEPNYGMAIVTKHEESRKLYPWRNARFEFVRQFQRVKTACGYSFLYQHYLKPKYFAVISFFSSIVHQNK